MYEVGFSSAASAAFDLLPMGDAVEILQKLDIAERIGVSNEVAIAAVNSDYLVHVLSPPCPPIIITIHDRCAVSYPTSITVTHIETINGLDHYTKRRLANEAATAAGVNPANVQIF